jgi:hypothetical protein
MNAMTTLPPFRFSILLLYGVLALSIAGCDRGVKVLRPVEGGSLNAAFPEDSGSFKVVFVQEKQGFVQAVLKDGSIDVATLAVADLIDSPDARAKFVNSTDQIGGAPVAASGAKGTTLLVADRYQVQVRSQTEAFDESARRAWLGKFKLDRLSQLARK